jgi:His-Xaa-Ser system protein HxsD
MAVERKLEAASNLVSLELDEAIYPRAVGVATAYRFLDRCYIRLARLPKNRLQVEMKAKDRHSAKALEALAKDFGNELIHQLMRHQVAERTDSLREIIVGRALLSAEASPDDGSSTGDLVPDQTLDYLDDPLGIAIPWEEKYGDKKKEDGKKKKE